MIGTFTKGFIPFHCLPLSSLYRLGGTWGFHIPGIFWFCNASVFAFARLILELKVCIGSKCTHKRQFYPSFFFVSFFIVAGAGFEPAISRFLKAPFLQDFSGYCTCRGNFPPAGNFTPRRSSLYEPCGLPGCPTPHLSFGSPSSLSSFSLFLLPFPIFN